MSQEPDDLADQLRAARARHGLTQASLAEVLGVTPITVSRWETGNHAPRGERVRRQLHRLLRPGESHPFAQGAALPWVRDAGLMPPPHPRMVFPEEFIAYLVKRTQAQLGSVNVRERIQAAITDAIGDEVEQALHRAISEFSSRPDFHAAAFEPAQEDTGDN